MADLAPIHEQIRRIRDNEDSDREVRESLASIERSLTEMESNDDAPKADRVKEVRAEIDRLADTGGETARMLDRLRERVRNYEREAT
ncbi:hypothetical protein BRC82_02180 [Halobacteriales archaeon QS_1_67_19]|nr:MAG: hypothetical protein BRC82_02180 [Halobacteriales archaeon QS_1_67_19]